MVEFPSCPLVFLANSLNSSILSRTIFPSLPSINSLTTLAISSASTIPLSACLGRSPTFSPSFFTQSGTSGNESKPFGFLPDGYLGRIKDRGLLVPSWAPQIKVLSHGSTGGFLTHCGWNSILESMVNGVPLITWPLYAEQKMNAVLLNEGLKVGLRPKQAESGIVEAEEIASVVKELMEGNKGKIARERMEEFRELARKTRGQDGNSTITLNQVAQEWSVK